MLSFSSDADLARVEPGVFGSWFLSSQVLCSGTNGIVSGTQFTASGVDFNAAQIAAGQVIWLESADGAIKGAFEIVDMVDSTHLTVSVLRAGPSTSSGQAIPVGSGSGLTWRIVTYGPQAYEVLFALSQKLGLSPGCADAAYDVADITNPDSLRQVSVYGVLVRVFEALYAGLEGQDVLVEKKEHYERQYGKALERLTVNVDTDGDGTADQCAQPMVVQMLRE